MRSQLVHCTNCGHAATFHHTAGGKDFCSVRSVKVFMEDGTPGPWRNFCKCDRFEERY